MPYVPEQPYNDLPDLPHAETLETRGNMRVGMSLARDLAELRKAAAELPNPYLLVNTVTLLEARSSSEIENVMTTDDELFSAQSSAQASDPMTKEVHRYREAIWEGYALAKQRPISTPTVTAVCSKLRDREVDVRSGEVKIRDMSDNSVVYTPPVGQKLIRDKLDRLWAWMHQDDEVPVLLKAAAAHYQFEAIHPFPDGNGRTGRILVVLYLVEQGVLDWPALWLSGEILKRRSEYNAWLRSTTETGQVDAFVGWLMSVMGMSAVATLARVDSIRIAMDDVSSAMLTHHPKMHSRDLVETLFSWPIVSAKDLVENKVVASRTTATKYLNRLTEPPYSYLESYRRGRNLLFINIKLWNELKKDQIDDLISAD